MHVQKKLAKTIAKVSGLCLGKALTELSNCRAGIIKLSRVTARRSVCTIALVLKSGLKPLNLMLQILKYFWSGTSWTNRSTLFK
jgi:hypothetical protein